MGFQMAHIDETSFGRIIIDGLSYRDVLIVDGRVSERDHARLKELYGTGHVIGDYEMEQLLSGEPQAIVVGTGQSGVLDVPESISSRLGSKGIELIQATTPEAAQIYNRLTEGGRRVNALIHTTC